MLLIYLIFILIVLTILSTAYLREQSQALAQRTNGIKAVHDVVHEYLPDLSAHYKVYDFLLLVFVAPLILSYGTYDPIAFLINFAWLMTPLLIYRCFTICASIPTKTTTDIERDFGPWLQQHLFGGDSDLMFSAHVAVALALILLMLKRKIIKNKALWLGLLAAYGLFSSMSRSHFTGDVLLAIPVVFLFYDWTECKSASKDLLWGGCTV